MRKVIILKCKCCGESFETTRKDKLYLDKSHQVRHNNQVQYDKYRLLMPLQLRERQTYLIYLRLLGKKESVTYKRDYLKGTGADLSLLNGFTPVDGKNEMSLFDVIIKFHPENHQLITLKRKTT